MAFISIKLYIQLLLKSSPRSFPLTDIHGRVREHFKHVLLLFVRQRASLPIVADKRFLRILMSQDHLILLNVSNLCILGDALFVICVVVFNGLHLQNMLRVEEMEIEVYVVQFFTTRLS